MRFIIRFLLDDCTMAAKRSGAERFIERYL